MTTTAAVLLSHFVLLLNFFYLSLVVTLLESGRCNICSTWFFIKSILYLCLRESDFFSLSNGWKIYLYTKIQIASYSTATWLARAYNAADILSEALTGCKIQVRGKISRDPSNPLILTAIASALSWSSASTGPFALTFLSPFTLLYSTMQEIQRLLLWVLLLIHCISLTEPLAWCLMQIC